ncbi:MAG: hypothetical protein CMM80_00355 [Rhodospirillaceae bacterium]|nr:hypothetical protein [Rhodospirillaceae bacterium]
MKAALTSTLKPKFCDDIIRLGRKNDGGYLVSKSDVIASDKLLSFGIYDDWSFEVDFANINDVPIMAFDASSGLKLLLKKARRRLASFKLLKALFFLGRAFSFTTFFSDKRIFISKFVGLDLPPIHISMEKVFEDFASKKIFLKMDIEGSEYRCLEAIIQNQEKICGLAIEFHDVDLHLDKINYFIKKLNLTLIHVHANNSSPVTSFGVPLVLELTFSQNCASSPRETTLPHKLDAPNDPRKPEILLSFS